MRRLVLLRHPPVCLPPGTCYGASDVAARPARRQALAAVRAALTPLIMPLSTSAPTAVISSPLRRCADLAAQLAPAGTPPSLDARLQEIDFGDWELQPWATLDRAQIDAWAARPWTFRPPGGERANDMRDRVLAAWADTLQQARRQGTEQVLIVTHGGPLRVLRGHLLGLPQRDWLAWSCPPGGHLRLRARAAGGWRLDP